MENQNVKLGDKIVYKWKVANCSRDGQQATVVDWRKGNMKTGDRYKIRFADNYQMWVFADEVTPIETE